MPSTGYIQARAFSSNAQFPLQGVAVSITAQDGTALALELTDRSGLTKPIPLPVPDLSESQSPNPESTPFTVVNLHARIKGYEQITAKDIQLFADTTTLQELEMIPLAELPDSWNKAEIFDTPPQNL